MIQTSDTFNNFISTQPLLNKKLNVNNVLNTTQQPLKLSDMIKTYYNNYYNTTQSGLNSSTNKSSQQYLISVLNDDIRQANVAVSKLDLLLKNLLIIMRTRGKSLGELTSEESFTIPTLDILQNVHIFSQDTNSNIACNIAKNIIGCGKLSKDSNCIQYWQLYAELSHYFTQDKIYLYHFMDKSLFKVPLPLLQRNKSHNSQTQKQTLTKKTGQTGQIPKYGRRQGDGHGRRQGDGHRRRQGHMSNNNMVKLVTAASSRQPDNAYVASPVLHGGGNTDEYNNNNNATNNQQSANNNNYVLNNNANNNTKNTNKIELQSPDTITKYIKLDKGKDRWKKVLENNKYDIMDEWVLYSKFCSTIITNEQLISVTLKPTILTDKFPMFKRIYGDKELYKLKESMSGLDLTDVISLNINDDLELLEEPGLDNSAKVLQHIGDNIKDKLTYLTKSEKNGKTYVLVNGTNNNKLTSKRYTASLTPDLLRNLILSNSIKHFGTKSFLPNLLLFKPTKTKSQSGYPNVITPYKHNNDINNSSEELDKILPQPQFKNMYTYRNGKYVWVRYIDIDNEHNLKKEFTKKYSLLNVNNIQLLDDTPYFKLIQLILTNLKTLYYENIIKNATQTLQQLNNMFNILPIEKSITNNKVTISSSILNERREKKKTLIKKIKNIVVNKRSQLTPKQIQMFINIANKIQYGIKVNNVDNGLFNKQLNKVTTVINTLIKRTV
jgi:hypothetical protein